MKQLLSIIAVSSLLAVSCAKEQSQPKIAVTSVTLSPESIELEIGEQKVVTATVSPNDATDKTFTFSSSKESVATVSNDGIVEAIAAGSAIVTVTTKDGNYKDQCSITVKEKTVYGAVTGTATHISCRNAEISGKANLPKTTTTDLSFGVLYSTSSGVLIGSAVQIIAPKFDSDYNFTVNTKVLEPNTTYYYRSYIIQGKEIAYGELKSFKTLAVSSLIATMDATDINPKDAVLNASLNLTDCKYDTMEYGFEITPEGGTLHAIKSTNYSQDKFSVKDEGLTRDTKYSFVAYVNLDGQTYKGEAKSFTTTSIQASVTAESSNISYHTATISGKLTITSEGTFTKTADLYYSSTATTLEELKSSGAKKILTVGADDSYSVDLSSLVSDTNYYYVVVSKVDEIEINSDLQSFSTLKIQASITADSSNIKCKTATVSGKLQITSEGSFQKSISLYYSTEDTNIESLKSSGTKITPILEADGTFCANLSLLSHKKTYYYVVVSIIDDREFTTDVKSFTTLEIQAVITAESSDIQSTTATISGKLTITSEGTFIKSADLYHSSTVNTIDDLKSNGTKQAISLKSDGTYSVIANGLVQNAKNYYCVIVKIDNEEFATTVGELTTSSLPEGAVDLGLSILWHKCNIGASKPEEYGKYFAWGDVNGQKRNGSAWSGSGFSTAPTYEVDSKGILKPEYDAAHVILGEKWRMPTREEIEELINNCTITWTADYNGTGIAGRIFTSNKAGFTDKSIFFPAGGGGSNSYLTYTGSYGYYWSSSLYVAVPEGSWDLNFTSSMVSTNSHARKSGFNIRPVSSK